MRWWFVAALLSDVAGCSGEGPVTYPVTGKVESAGGETWAGGTITFQSVSAPEMLASGEIEADGSFTLTTHYVMAGQAKTRAGAVAGEHTVTLQPPEEARGRGKDKKTKPSVLSKKYHIEMGPNALVVQAPR
jgi:hypothetical protein